MRFGPLALALALALVFSALAAAPAEAAVLCQKRKAVKLRADACKPKETQIGTVGDGGVAGIWERTGGTLQNYEGMTARYLVLGADGSGQLNASRGPILGCVPLNYARNTNETLVVDDFGWLVGTRVYRTAHGGDTLELTDPVGETAVFSRASSVDPAADCEPLVEAARFTGLPEPHSVTGLAFDGTDLWYTDETGERAVSVNPETGARGVDLPLSSDFVHAAQGADFWTHCDCGGTDHATRVSRPGATIDTVETEADLGEELFIESLAFQSAAGVLWISGWNQSKPRLMKVDAGGEPDVLVEAFDTPLAFGGMTFAGNELWALDDSNQTVLRIDPATGQPAGTFAIPDRTARWLAIAAIGDHLFVLGASASTEAVTLRKTRARSAGFAAIESGVILVVEKP